jgi:hypothetical protein
MESVVDPQITAELTQILSNLVLGDNEIRQKWVLPCRIHDFFFNTHILHSAEKAVNDRLAHTPELYLLALAQFAISADTEVVRDLVLSMLI